VVCQHGKIPVPSPATVELLKGAPVYSTGIEAELTTPTGAAILTTLADAFGPLPAMTVEAVGYGSGSRDLEIPNLLRLIVGRSEMAGLVTDRVALIEANIDDMTGEQLGYAAECLREAGALDVWLTPLQMKKGRPGSMLSVLAAGSDAETLIEQVLAETTTLGVRLQRMERRKLPRRTQTVSTRFGDIRVKTGVVGEQIKPIAPEYEDCAKAARREGVPLSVVYDEARRAAERKLQQ
jgi:uncharacterized protein (TIGR00299 family) protein